jgi:CheY-specific phosphatase CheX
MAYTLDEETRKRLQDINGLDEVVSKIVTELQANENGDETIHILVGLSASYDVEKPSVAIGRKLNHIASAIRARSGDLAIPPVISFFKEEAA